MNLLRSMHTQPELLEHWNIIMPEHRHRLEIIWKYFSHYLAVEWGVCVCVDSSAYFTLLTIHIADHVRSLVTHMPSNNTIV